MNFRRFAEHRLGGYEKTHPIRAAVGLGLLIVLITAGLFYVKFDLSSVGPAPHLTIRATAAQIEHGRYLTNHVAACVDCHSQRDYTELAGPMVPGTEGKGGDSFLRAAGFPGNYYALNLTPAHLGNWTDGEIFHATTTGVRIERSNEF